MSEFSQLDIVQIRTTKNVKWYSAPKDSSPNPHGHWTVATIFSDGLKDELLITKDEVVVRIPSSDVTLVAAYDSSRIIRGLSKYGKVDKVEEDDKRRTGSE